MSERLIYKCLQGSGYIYTGMLFLAVVAGEHETTGVREAVVTAELMASGELTPESYPHSWAQDPYDSTYRGVDRSLLRFMSDHERFDERFPQHPLSKARRVLAALPGSVKGLR